MPTYFVTKSFSIVLLNMLINSISEIIYARWVCLENNRRAIIFVCASTNKKFWFCVSLTFNLFFLNISSIITIFFFSSHSTSLTLIFHSCLYFVSLSSSVLILSLTNLYHNIFFLISRNIIFISEVKARNSDEGGNSGSSILSFCLCDLSLIHI